MSTSIFEYPIAYVESLGNFEAVHDSARAAGVKGLAIKLWDSNPNPVISVNEAYLAANRQVLTSQGFALGFWACPRFQPENCAASISTLYAKYGLSFGVFETEAEYKLDGGKVDVKRLLEAWRLKRPKAYTGFAVEGMVPTTFDHAALIADPLTFLCPETYQHVGYDVEAAFKKAASLGWDVKRVKPTLSGVETDSMAESLIRMYRAYATYGYLLWRGDMLNADDYRLVGLATGLART